MGLNCIQPAADDFCADLRRFLAALLCVTQEKTTIKRCKRRCGRAMFSYEDVAKGCRFLFGARGGTASSQASYHSPCRYQSCGKSVDLFVDLALLFKFQNAQKIRKETENIVFSVSYLVREAGLESVLCQPTCRPSPWSSGVE